MNPFTKESKCDSLFYGAATIGERGQIVIPAEARSELNLNPGDKLLIMRHPINPGLMMFKLEAAREFLDMIQRTFQSAVDAAQQGEGE